ncbi:MAG: transposase, partial [Pseudomonadales bacterium]|nr:transposase [Pseudomonadales bacterium]
MNQKYSVSFRMQAVKKALNSSHDISLKHIAESLGVGYSTLQLWIRLARK